MPYFEFIGEDASRKSEHAEKFWEITQVGKKVTVRFGKFPPQEIVLDVTTRRVQVRVEGRAAPDATLEIILGDGGNGVAGDRIAIHRGCFIRQG